MFKKIKENKAYQKFKELRANPRTRAMMSLGMWLIFFVIVVIFLRSMNSQTNVPSTSVQEQNDFNSYEFTYQNNDLKVFGMFYDGKMIFNVGANKYYYNGNVYLVDGHNLVLQEGFDLNVLKITLPMIQNLTSGESSEIEGGKQYAVPLSNFINLYEVDTEVDLSLAMQYNIVIQVFENEEITSVKLDLSNYYSFRGYNDSGILTIDVYNVNKIADVSEEYEKMLGVK